MVERKWKDLRPFKKWLHHHLFPELLFCEKNIFIVGKVKALSTNIIVRDYVLLLSRKLQLIQGNNTRTPATSVTSSH